MLPLVSLILDELRAYHERLGTRTERLFYFPGQDPFAFAEPSEAIAGLYWARSEGEARQEVTMALIDVLGARMDALPVRGLEDVVLAVGLVQEASVLLPMARRIAARPARGNELRPLHVRALMVLKGFGVCNAAAEAALVLAGSSAFPADLVYDAFEIAALDARRCWSKAMLELLPRMNCDVARGRPSRVRGRLASTAAFLAKRLSVGDLASGLELVLSIDHEALRGRGYAERGDPTGILAHALLTAPHAPLVVEQSASPQYGQVRRRCDGASVLLEPASCLTPKPRHAVEPNERFDDIPVLEALEPA